LVQLAALADGNARTVPACLFSAVCLGALLRGS
jgi:hypothetical protein